MQIVSANTLLVIADHSRDLDYFKDLTQYPFLMDMDELKEQFSKDSEKKLVYLRIFKIKNEKLSGEFVMLGHGKKKIKKFRNYSKLSDVYLEHLEGKTDLIILGHTLSDARLKQFLPNSSFQFETIMTSACKMATIKKLNMLGKHTDLVLASPENVHLSHFEHLDIIQTMTGSALEKAQTMSTISFDRMLSFTKSNLVLNTYDVSEVLSQNICDSQNELSSILIDQKIKLSIFERKQTTHSQFILKDCQRSLP